MTPQITDDFIAQICPADLANQVCDFDYVMPNGCDHNCEMLRLCLVSLIFVSLFLMSELIIIQVYVAHCGYECPNTDDDNLKCPYVHGVAISCSNVNRQFAVLNETHVAENPVRASWEATVTETKKEEKNKKKGKVAKDRFTCSLRLADDCQRGHDYQAARTASYGLLQKHQHAGRILHGLETETFDEKVTREARIQAVPSKDSKSGKGMPLPSDANPTLVVKGMAYATTEEDLKGAFETYGNIKRVNVLKKDGVSKGTGFVDFNDVEHAAAAHEGMQGASLNGRTIRVKFKGDQGNGQGGGGSRACYTCNQEGHMSRDCPTKGSNQAGGSDNYDNGQVQSLGEAWGDGGGNSTAGGDWANSGGASAQESTNDWNTGDTGGNDTTQGLSGW